MGRKKKIRGGPRPAAGKRQTASACMIVKNEQEMLPKCLASIAEVMDEIIVVDTGSSDRTIEIAEEFGCRVYRFPWTGDFSAARNESLAYAEHDWIFIIDADEELPAGESSKLRRAIERPDADIVSLTVYNKSLETGRVSSVLPSVRLFRRRLNLRYEGIVHNRLSLPPKAPVARSDISLFHYGYDLDAEKLKKKRGRSCALLEKQLERDPNDVFANFNMGQSLLGLRGTENRAICERIADHARRVIEYADPDQSGHIGYRLMAHHHMAIALSGLSRYDEARQYCLDAIAEKDDYIDAILTLANIYLAEADLDNARIQYERFLSAVDAYRPEKERHDIIMHYVRSRHIARYGLGTIYRLSGRIDDALREYYKVIHEHAAYLDAGYQIGVLHIRRGEPARAEDILNREIARDPDSSPVLIALARAIELQGRGDRAAASLETALVKAPGDPDVLLALATTLIRLGRVDDGKSRLEAMVAADPANPIAAFAAAGVYFDLGDYEKAQILYRISLEHKPFWPEAYTNLGNCFFKRERYEEARAAYETALALAPGSTLACRNLALAHAREEEYDRAIETLEQHFRHSPNSPGMCRLMGDFLSLSGRYSDAIGYYERHLLIFPDDLECLFQVAEAYRKSGHIESAAEGYRHLLKINPGHKSAQKRLETLGDVAPVR